MGRELINATVDGARGHSGTDLVDYGDEGNSGTLFVGHGRNLGLWYLGLEGSYADSNTAVNHYKTKDDAQSIELDAGPEYAIDARLGRHLPGQNLVYLRLGRSYRQVDTYNAVNNQPAGAHDDEKWRHGNRYGLGTDIPLSHNSFLRLDYGLTQSKAYDVSYTDNAGDPAQANYEPESRTFTLGLGWRPSTAPIAAVDTRQQQGFYAALMAGDNSLSSAADGIHNDGGTSSDFYGDFGGNGHLSLTPVIGYALEANPWQLALELEADALRDGWQHDRDPSGRDFGVEQQSNLAASARLGYRLNNGALMFATAGVDRARFKTTWDKGNNSENQVSRDDEVWGWHLGVGAELPLGERTALRLDYTETDYDDYSFTTEHGNADDMTFDNRRSHFRVGLNVYF